MSGTGTNNGNDICKVEQGVQKAKYIKNKFPQKADRRAEGSPPSHHEISEESIKNGNEQKGQKAPRPNYFIAVQVTDAKVLENAKRIQDGILENSPADLGHMKVDVSKSHLTLMAMHLADPLDVDGAKQSLDQCVSTIDSTSNSGPMSLEFEGLGVFSGGSVLFVTVKHSPGLQSLTSLADFIREDMSQRGIVSAGKDFIPHMTLMKYRRKKQTKNSAKKVEKDAYKKFEKHYLGMQTVASVQLCKMEGVREDGYYIVEHEVFLNS